MPRRKPASGKQHKAELQLKRAVKRGDVPPQSSEAPTPYRRKPNPSRRGPTVGSAPRDVPLSTRQLQSSFVKMPEKFLQDAKRLASEVPLPRPIPSAASILLEIDHAALAKFGALTCPRRPKWRYDMSKNEIEKNEEGMFKIWLKDMDDIVTKWREAPTPEPPKDGQSFELPRSPTYYERNLEVWRQLWRVTEISQILLVLLDSRCPLLHFPPSLSAFLSSHKVILVLTKIDIAGPNCATAWTAHLKAKYPTLRIVQVESYVARERTDDSQGRRMFDPHLPMTFRERLVQALQEAHEELLAHSKEASRKNSNSSPHIKREINWQQVLNAHGDMVGSTVGGPTAPKERDMGDTELPDAEPSVLTIGLIGQPNVGKSSLLNALFETHKVKASKTPGKTKHFQTLFWTPEVRLVDCPGLVMPNFVPLEMQVLSGILPIASISSIPSCVHHAARLLPLERIFRLTHSSSNAPPVVDKRTWREGARSHPGTEPTARAESERTQWTAMEILTAYAEQNGWLTAKAGRPDVMRAGNAILRAVAEGRVRWAFWPEGTVPRVEDVPSDSGCGIWIPGTILPENPEEEEESDGQHLEQDEDEDDAALQTESEEEERSAESESEEPGKGVAVGVGRFAALSLEED